MNNFDFYNEEFSKYGVIVIDRGLNIQCFNSMASVITGYNPEEVIGKKCHNIISNTLCDLICRKETLSNLCEVKKEKSTVRHKEKGWVNVNIKSIPIECDGYTNGIIKLISLEVKKVANRREMFKEVGLIGESLPMKTIFEQIEKVAPTRATVLIQGQTGTGKEVVADAIHMFSQRNDKLLVKVNCAALTETLLESELFGHEKGAFTSAYKKHIGKFELANNGTIFLDEIAEISPGFQSKLLRVLENGTMSRVGSSEVIKVDTRIIAATNKDLKEMVDKGYFRKDLYFRLSIYPIYLPTLNERIEDIPELIERFLYYFNRTHNKSITRIAPEVLNILLNYEYTGNIRQLRNIIEHSLINTDSDTIEMGDLPAEVINNPYKSGVSHQGPPVLVKENFRKGEKKYYEYIIKMCNGNKTKAAQLLGISRKTLYNKIKIGQIIMPPIVKIRTSRKN